MKTIAVFHPSSELYGADRILAGVLKNMDPEIRKVVYLREEGPFVPFLKENVRNVEFRFNKKLPLIYRDLFSLKGIFMFLINFLRFFIFLRKENKRTPFQRAYVNTLACSFMLIPLRLLRIPRFIHVHEIIENPKLVRYATTYLARYFSDRVVCVSGAVLENMKGTIPSIVSKAEIIYNGIDPVTESGTVLGDKINFYLFGRIKKEKGQWFLLKAIKYLPKGILSRCRFFLVGSPVPGKEYQLEELHDYLEKNQLSDYVKFKSFVPDISAEMKAADVCLVPSLMKDPFPTTVLEAMSAGKAIISTNHGGASEALEDDCGILIKPNDIKALSAAIEGLIKTPEKIRKLGARAYKRYESNYTSEVFAKNWQVFLRAM